MAPDRWQWVSTGVAVLAFAGSRHLADGSARAEPSAGTASTVLVAIDSVRVRETPTVTVARIGSVAASGRRTFIADAGEAHVLEVSPTGAIVRVFGRKGRGPGEFTNPGAMALAGDSILYAMDNGQRRVSVFNLRDGKFTRSFVVNTFLPTIKVVGPDLVATSLDEQQHTALAVASPSGELTNREGVIPSIGIKLPMLVQPLPHVAFAVDGADVYAAFELSQSLYHWKRGSRSADEIHIPVKLRRGVDDTKYEAMVREPAKAGTLVYDHSVPVALGFVSPGVLALVTLDPVVERGKFSGAHHVTLVDVRQRKTCPEVLVPAPRDPLPYTALDGNTLVVAQQAIGKDGELATAVRRFRIDPSLCLWEPVK